MHTKDRYSNQRNKIRTWTILVLVIILALCIKKLACQNISSIADFKEYINSFGMAGPLVLTFVQAFQVVIPILPGYLGCAVGAMAFGSGVGFLCNYIGISLGSIAAYYIAKGICLIRIDKDKVLIYFKIRYWQRRLYRNI